MIHLRELRNGLLGMCFVYVPDITLLGIGVYLASACTFGAVFWFNNDLQV